MPEGAPYPLEGSYVSEISGIYIRTLREADTIKLLNLAVHYGVFTWEGEFGDRFRVTEENGVWVCRTHGQNKITVWKHISKKFCDVYGFVFEEF